MTTYSAVVTTGIYCRPGCAARPLAQNVQAFDQPAAAEAAGFRACYRCRPYRVAAPVTTNAPELVCEAVQQIIGGAMDDGGTEAMLAAGLQQLPRLQREVFLIRAQQGLEYEEIAAALATTPGAARVHYHHAVKRLKEIVK